MSNMALPVRSMEFLVVTHFEKNVLRETCSKSAFRIESRDDGGAVSTATGFFFETGDALFIVTNWHVVSGKHFLTKQSLSAAKRLPTHLICDFLVSGDTTPDGHSMLRRLPVRVELYDHKDRNPLWSEHPIDGSRCDVVALPIGGSLSSSKIFHKAANSIDEEGRIPVNPGSTVFVIGFPRSLSIRPGLPLWKSGYIASEPTFDVSIGEQTLPAFFIDSQTREGMSGSPVFARHVGMWNPDDPYGRDANEHTIRDNTMIGSAMQFVGCYSARIGPEEEGATLGLCWRAEIIREVCQGRTRAEHPHFTRLHETGS